MNLTQHAHQTVADKGINLVDDGTIGLGILSDIRRRYVASIESLPTCCTSSRSCSGVSLCTTPLYCSASVSTVDLMTLCTSLREA